MGAPDCGTCEMLGYRSCDVCGGPCWDDSRGNAQNRFIDGFGREVCIYCKK